MSRNLRTATSIAIFVSGILIVVGISVASSIVGSRTQAGAATTTVVDPPAILPVHTPAKSSPTPQTPQVLPSAPGVVESFDGLGSCGTTYCWSPGEPDVAVGPTDIVETVNTQAAIYDKATGSQLAVIHFEISGPVEEPQTSAWTLGLSTCLVMIALPSAALKR